MANNAGGSQKIRDTKLGEFLSSKFPKVLDIVGDLLPDSGAIGVVKRLIASEPDVSPEDRMELERLSAETEQVAQQEVTKRWEADMKGDVALAKYIRPATMIILMVFFMAMMIWDGIDPDFIPKESYVNLLEILMLTVFGAYFAGRTIEKTRR
jgi:hypothetical protein